MNFGIVRKAKESEEVLLEDLTLRRLDYGWEMVFETYFREGDKLIVFKEFTLEVCRLRSTNEEMFWDNVDWFYNNKPVSLKA